jgi:hypothetical protein
MKRISNLIVILAVMLACVFPAGAVPTTDPITGLSGNEVTFHGTADPLGVIGWFQWGGKSNGPYYWSTPNQTVTGGAAYSDYQWGPPLLTCSTYFAVACDNTGCGNEVQFTTPTPRMLNLTSYGSGLLVMMRSGMNVTKTLDVIVKPYTEYTTAPITYFLLFFFIFVGLWMRPKDTFIPMVMAMISSGVIWGSSAIGMLPPQFMDIGQGLLYAAVAGFAFSLFTK